VTPAGVRAVIVTHRSRGEVAAAVRSCIAEGLRPSQVTVVDNASDDDTCQVVRRTAPGVRLLRLDRNLGFGRAVNRGAAGGGAPAGDAADDGAALLVLNPDAELRPGALAAMCAALDADPRRGAVSPRIDRPDGSLDLACRRSFPSPAVALFRLSGLSRLFPRQPRLAAYNRTDRAVDQAEAIDSGSGACLLVRRTAWDRVRGFDPAYFMYGEDLDLCWRLRAAGYTVWYAPQARVLHRKGGSSRQRVVPMLWRFHGSMWRFYRQHYARGWGVLLAPGVAIGICGRLAALTVWNLVRRDPRVSR